ncbi:MAG TPA: hypothetical protein VG406_23375 [Isosphaeraceae bacterium]|jgi:hypothetical protein|nr:hypothetical protein [Isosphaeraceae bacterium]
MPRLHVSFRLPFALDIHADAYRTSPAGEAVRVGQAGPSTGRDVSAEFDHRETTDLDEIDRFRKRDADELIQRANRLIRWCRALGHHPEQHEVTRHRASPFQFEVEGAADPTHWIEPLIFEPEGATPVPPSIDELTAAVRAGLAGGGEPDVADLFLIDAEQAIREGRFREAVLFCWSTIDATFNRKYEALVDSALAGEWADAKKSLTGVDFGLRNKMTAILYLVAGRSLFREPDGLWDRLAESYRKRNAIIHRGEGAAEDDARTALGVARGVVAVMRSIGRSLMLSDDIS